MTSTVEEVFKVLSVDKDFLTNIEIGMIKIMNDGKMDSSDIPELILIITTTYNNMKTFKLTENEFPALLKLLCKHIIEKYKLIELTPSKVNEIDKLIDSTIRLVMVKPSIEEVAGMCSSLVKCICK